jgi:hypothetical protein
VASCVVTSGGPFFDVYLLGQSLRLSTGFRVPGIRHLDLDFLARRINHALLRVICSVGKAREADGEHHVIFFRFIQVGLNIIAADLLCCQIEAERDAVTLL